MEQLAPAAKKPTAEPLWMQWQREYFEQRCQSVTDIAWRRMAEEINSRIARKWAKLDRYGRPKQTINTVLY